MSCGTLEVECAAAGADGERALIFIINPKDCMLEQGGGTDDLRSSGYKITTYTRVRAMASD